MYKKILAASVFALSFNLLQPIAFACDSHHHTDVSKLAKKLGLTDEQKTKITAIVTQSHMELDRSKGALRNIIIQADEQFVSNTMDNDKIDAFVNKETPIMAEIVKIRMKERMEISKVLTDTQKAKFVEILVKKHEKNS